ncbi:MAG: chemotaxis protein CheB, partial [Desulfuromusa sp.]|nr:chemotaxis protein CheB [Desulfuromusa sp.]
MAETTSPKKKTAAKKAPPNPAAKSKLAPASFPIVGIGASAGGLEAFESFFNAMPADSGMAFILVAHLDPSHVSLLPELLQKATKMPVCHIKDGTVVKPNNVYVIPPNNELHILQGRLQLMELSQPRGAKLPIDSFFRSLAEDQGSNAVCIILSGTGTDGTLGLKAIKGEVGMVMVQDEQSAKYDGMPRSAIATGQVDFVLPVSEMPEQLINYTKGVTNITGRRLAPTKEDMPDALQKIFIILRRHTGHDFSLYKMNTICRRIERRMNLRHIEEITDYVSYLRENALEANILFRELLIGVTNFFRDPDAFKSLQKLLQQLLESKPDHYTLRVWVAGCSSGEEAYSVAMLLRECMDETQRQFNIQIFGTDIDPEAIALARAGLYPPSILADVGPERLKRHFTKEDDGRYRINMSIREALVFAQQNIIKDPPFTKLDLVCCRNLLIYLGPELQSKLLPTFHYTLNPGGLLFLGSSESVGQHADLFKTEHKKWKIFRRKVTSDSHHPHFDLSSPLLGDKNADETTGEINIKQAEEPSTLQLIETILHESDTPPCAIINDACDIVYIHGRTGRYLEPAEGKTSVNILEMARSGLKTVLTTAIHKVGTDNQQVDFKDLHVQFNGGSLNLNLTVKPVHGHGRTRNLMMVMFQENKATEKGEMEGKRRTSNKRGNKNLEELELELQHTRESLQTTIEEMETANEELKSTNEELQSTNEELQSTNEEMETSKEELQSLNEESVTVNAELQNRIDQLSIASDDMKNLLDSTEIATIFLDTDLCIRLFTPTAASIIPLSAMDTGRPIQHFASTLIDIDLKNYSEQVLDTLSVKEVEVQSNEGRSFYMRVRPYRTVANVIDGVVLTFDDVTEHRLHELALQESETKYRLLVKNSPYGIHEIDLEGRFTSINPAGLRMLNVETEDKIIGTLYLNAASKGDKKRISNLLQKAIEGQFSEFVFDSVNGSVYQSLFFPITGPENAVIRLMGLTLDISERTQLEHERRVQSDLLKCILDTLPDGLAVKEANSTYTLANSSFCRFLNKREEDIIGKTDIDLFPRRSAEKYLEIEADVVQSGRKHSV